MGGLATWVPERVRLTVGRIKADSTLPGDEPITGLVHGCLDSRDGGRTWSELSQESACFRRGRSLTARATPPPVGRTPPVGDIGTVGRDVGMAERRLLDRRRRRRDLAGHHDRGRGRSNFADTDLVRLPDGRFLAVIREMVTRRSQQAWSADEGQRGAPSGRPVSGLEPQAVPVAQRGHRLRLPR